MQEQAKAAFGSVKPESPANGGFDAVIASGRHCQYHLPEPGSGA